jgi:hypothetical protein
MKRYLLNLLIGIDQFANVAACWEKAHEILAAVQAQTRPIPTVEEFLAEMPAIVLPEV